MGLVKKAQGLQRFMMDCGFWRARKWVGADLAAIGLQACGISYCYEHGTDGRLPKDDLALALGLREKDVRNAVSTLLKRGIWRLDDGGFEIVGYADHNPSQAEVTEHRTRKTTAGLKGNHERWHGKKKDPLCPFCDSPNESGNDPHASPNRIASAIPTPSESDRTIESQSRVEERRVDPPLSPLSQVGADPRSGVAGPTAEEDLENPEPPAVPDPLVELLGSLWPNRPRMRAECSIVVAKCLAVADRSVVDQAIGDMLTLDASPHSPKYLLATVKNRLVSMGAYGPNDAALEPLGAA